jgi:hypothetical protein
MNDLFMSGNAMLADVWLCCRTMKQTFLPEPLANILGLHSYDQREVTQTVCGGIHNVYERSQILANAMLAAITPQRED